MCFALASKSHQFLTGNCYSILKYVQQNQRCEKLDMFHQEAKQESDVLVWVDINHQNAAMEG